MGLLPSKEVMVNCQYLRAEVLMQVLAGNSKFENDLAAKILTNLGLSQEAQGHFFVACESYRFSSLSCLFCAKTSL